MIIDGREVNMRIFELILAYTEGINIDEPTPTSFFPAKPSCERSVSKDRNELCGSHKNSLSYSFYYAFYTGASFDQYNDACSATFQHPLTFRELNRDIRGTKEQHHFLSH